jgi:F0F1-type ATP synthase membrane subunit b/b'
MEQLVNQLGELFLQAVPTVIIVFLFYFFLKWAFFGPIERVLHERASRIEGARKEREAIQAQVQEKEQAYRDALRAARGQIFTEQEAARRVVLDERSAAVAQARAAATEQIQTARKRIAAEQQAAQGELEASSQQLAEEIARSILGQRPLPSPTSGGVQ